MSATVFKLISCEEFSCLYAARLSHSASSGRVNRRAQHLLPHSFLPHDNLVRPANTTKASSVKPLVNPQFYPSITDMKDFT